MPFDPAKEKADRLERLRKAGLKGRVSSGAKRGGAVRRKAGYRMVAFETTERALMIREGEKERKGER